MTTERIKPPKPADLNQVTINQLKALGFSDDYQQTPRRLIISLSGRAKTGKSHFALTAPEPIIYINIDIGTEGVVGKFQDQGKKIYIYDLRVPKEATKDVWSKMWADFKVRVRKAYEIKTGTVVWDTGSEAYELARLAHFGRLTEVKPSDYAAVNNEWRDVLRTAYDAEEVNTIFIHKVKESWGMIPTNNGSRLGKTGKMELSGFSEMDYSVQLNGETDCRFEDGEPVFSVSVKDCRQNMKISGTLLEGPMCNFEFLLGLVHDK
jgi:hypothetical protein